MRVLTAIFVSFLCARTYASCSSQNVARPGHAVQSSTSSGGIANRAVDGYANSYWSGHSCTATARQYRPWWYVDIGRSITVCRVTLYNRRDSYANRLSNFVIFVTNRRPTRGFVARTNEICTTHYGISHNARTYYCNARHSTHHGRYVGVQLRTTNILTLCEVKINEFIHSVDIRQNPRGYLRSGVSKLSLLGGWRLRSRAGSIYYTFNVQRTCPVPLVTVTPRELDHDSTHGELVAVYVGNTLVEEQCATRQCVTGFPYRSPPCISNYDARGDIMNNSTNGFQVRVRLTFGSQINGCAYYDYQARHSYYVYAKVTLDCSHATAYPTKNPTTSAPTSYGRSFLRLAGRHSGRVEIKHQSVWKGICSYGQSSQQNLNNCKVVCKQLGYKYFVNWHVKYWGTRVAAWLGNVRCIGSEPLISHCPSDQWGSASYRCHYGSYQLGCTCSNLTPAPSTQGTHLTKPPSSHLEGHVRLSGGHFGRVEINHNGQWGTVYGGYSFSMTDCVVICRELGFSNAAGYSTHADPGEGMPIWLYGPYCQGHEETLARDHKCRFRFPMTDFSRPNSHTMPLNHQHDAGCDCKGNRGVTGGPVQNVTKFIDTLDTKVVASMVEWDTSTKVQHRFLMQGKGPGSATHTFMVKKPCPAKSPYPYADFDAMATDFVTNSQEITIELTNLRQKEKETLHCSHLGNDQILQSCVSGIDLTSFLDELDAGYDEFIQVRVSISSSVGTLYNLPKNKEFYLDVTMTFACFEYARSRISVTSPESSGQAQKSEHKKKSKGVSEWMWIAMVLLLCLLVSCGCNVYGMYTERKLESERSVANLVDDRDNEADIVAVASAHTPENEGRSTGNNLNNVVVPTVGVYEPRQKQTYKRLDADDS